MKSHAFSPDRMHRLLQIASVCFVTVLAVSCDRKSGPEASTRAPHGSYSLEWVNNDVPASMPAGQPTTIHVSVKNTGNWTWPNPATANPSSPDGSYAVRLSYRWASPGGKLLPQGSDRGELSEPVRAGDTANFSMDIVAPKEAGNYRLELDLVEELVSFFSTKGSKKLTVPVTVQ